MVKTPSFWMLNQLVCPVAVLNDVSLSLSLSNGCTARGGPRPPLNDVSCDNPVQRSFWHYGDSCHDAVEPNEYLHVPDSRDLLHICGGSHRTEEETEQNSLNYCLEREGSLVSGHNLPYFSRNKNVTG